MRWGIIASGLAHGGLVAGLLFGGAFPSSRPDARADSPDAVQVAVISGEAFAAMIAPASAPRIQSDAPAPLAPVGADGTPTVAQPAHRALAMVRPAAPMPDSAPITPARADPPPPQKKTAAPPRAEASGGAASRGGATVTGQGGNSAQAGQGRALAASWGAQIQARVARVHRVPPAAIRAGMGGEALVRIVISRDGRLISAQLRRSSGQPVLDQAALRAVQRARLPRAPDGFAQEQAQFDLPLDFAVN